MNLKTKQWGNSIGVIIPKQAVETLNLKANETIVITIEKKQNVLEELFGSLKFKKPTKEILDEFRKEMESKR